MNYQTIYNNLIDRATRRISEGYVEKHHIVPRCLGATSTTALEHSTEADQFQRCH